MGPAPPVALLYWACVFYVTVIIAAIIAFLLEPMVEFFMKMRFPQGLASFVVCSIALVSCGPGCVHRSHGHGGRSAGVQRTHQRIGGQRVHAHGTFSGKRVSDGGSAALPGGRRGSASLRSRPAPARAEEEADTPTTVVALIQEVRVRAEPTPPFNYIYDSCDLQRAADGLLRAVRGLFHAELARPWRVLVMVGAETR